MEYTDKKTHMTDQAEETKQDAPEEQEATAPAAPAEGEEQK